jgi:hypothetical protein
MASLCNDVHQLASSVVIVRTLKKKRRGSLQVAHDFLCTMSPSFLPNVVRGWPEEGVVPFLVRTALAAEREDVIHRYQKGM